MVFIYQSEHYADQDHDAGGDVLDEDNSGDEHAEERDEHVTPELSLNHLKLKPVMCTAHVYSHLVGLPAGVLSADREGAVGEVGLSHNLFDLVHGRDPLGWGAEQLVGQLDCGQLKFACCFDWLSNE